MDALKIDQHYIDLALTYGPKILTAVVILFVGLWLIKRLTYATDIGMAKSGIDQDLRPFLVSMMNGLLKIFLVLAVANIVGIETTSLVAVLASAAFAIGLALQGTLSNFAAGVMILIFKPYKAGDKIHVQSVEGRVKEIGIFNTTILTEQDGVHIVPNGKAIDGTISNFTPVKVVKTSVQIPVRYNSNFEEIEFKISGILRASDKVLHDIHAEIEIEKFEQDGFIISVSAAVDAKNLEEVTKDLNRNIYIELTNAGVKLGVRKAPK